MILFLQDILLEWTKKLWILHGIKEQLSNMLLNHWVLFLVYHLMLVNWIELNYILFIYFFLSLNLYFSFKAELADPLVTATHAVFVEGTNKGHKAPAAVVGLQFHHSSLATHFMNITSTVCILFYIKKKIINIF